MNAILLALIVAASPSASVECPRISDGGVEVDGFFKDWRESSGHRGPGGDSLTWELRAVRDTSRLYLVIGARDDHFVPTPAAETAADRKAARKGRWPGDHVLLSLPGDGDHPVRLALLPGDLEDLRPRVLLLGSRGRAAPLPGATIDGATRPGGGWILEVGLPLDRLGSGSVRADGMPLRVELRDDDGKGPPSTPSETLTLAFPEAALNYGKMLTTLELPPDTRPAAELWAQVGGDARQERAMLLGSVLAVLGEGLGEGAYYLYRLPFADRLTPLSIAAEDLNGDGRAELLVRFQVEERRGPERHRQVFLAVFQFADEELQQLFAAEIEHHGPDGQSVTNKVEIVPERSGKTRALRIELDEAKGVDVHDYKDIDGGYDNWYEEILLPWSEPRRRLFRYQDGRLLRVQ